MYNNDFVSCLLTNISKNISTEILNNAIGDYYEFKLNKKVNANINKNKKEKMTLLITTCNDLLKILDPMIDEMINEKKTFISKELSNYNPKIEFIFSENSENTPFYLVKNELKNKGYNIEFSSKYTREDLYAPLIKVYTVNITKEYNRIRTRE